LALALHDQKKDGEALLALAELRGNQLPVLLPTPVATNAPGPPIWAPTTPADLLKKNNSGASEDAVNQTIDTLLNFAPLASLETALSGNDAEHEAFRKELRMVLKERSLASEDFAGAANFSETEAEKQQFLDLAKRVEEFKNSTGDAAAQKGQQLRDYWEKASEDQLKLPLDSQETLGLLFNDDAPTGDLIRKSNARALKVDDATTDKELENRIPSLHSITWNQNITKANPSGELAPQALWKAILARRKFAEFSAYGLQRSLETHAGAESHREYDTLLSQYPDSVEAKKYAVYWTIPEPKQIVDEPDAPYFRNKQEQFTFHWTKALSDFATPSNRRERRDQWDVVCGNLAKLPDQVKNLDQKAFASVINSLVETAKPSANAVERMAVMNCMDDLQQLSQIPNLDPEIRDQYIRLRFRVMKSAPLADIPDINALYPAGQDFSDEQLRSDIADFLQKPRTAQIHDFIDFLNSALSANHRVDIQVFSVENPNLTNTVTARDFVALASQNESFLAKYTKSIKREAARVQQLRGLVYAARPMSGSYNCNWPESVSRTGKDGPNFYHQTSLDRAAYEKALRAYYEEFPHGKYPNAVLSYRADEALMTNQWGEALDALIALHDQKSDSQFQDQVAGELAYLFDQIDKDDLRQEVLAEILKRPVPRNLLQTYINCGGLPYLKDYLLGRLIRS